VLVVFTSAFWDRHPLIASGSLEKEGGKIDLLLLNVFIVLVLFH